MKLLPSRRNLCTPCNYAPCHVTSFEATYVRCVCVLPPALLHNDRDLLHATAVTQGWDRYQNKSQHIKQTHSWPWRTKFAPHSCWDSNLWPFDHESSALTTELFPLSMLSYPRFWVTRLFELQITFRNINDVPALDMNWVQKKYNARGLSPKSMVHCGPANIKHNFTLAVGSFTWVSQWCSGQMLSLADGVLQQQGQILCCKVCNWCLLFSCWCLCLCWFLLF